MAQNWSEELYRDMEEEVLLFIYQFLLFTGHAPAQREMADALAITRYRVRKLLERLAEKELIEREPGVPRGISLTGDGQEQASQQNLLQIVPGLASEETVTAPFDQAHVDTGPLLLSDPDITPLQEEAGFISWAVFLPEEEGEAADVDLLQQRLQQHVVAGQRKIEKLLYVEPLSPDDVGDLRRGEGVLCFTRGRLEPVRYDPRRLSRFARITCALTETAFEELMADAYVPEEVRVGQAFRVRVVVRPGEREAGRPRRHETVASDPVQIFWPATGQVELAIAIRAADCRIVGPGRQYVLMRRGQMTVPVHFQLVPLREGEIVIDVDILQRDDDVTRGTVAAWTRASAETAGTVRLRTHSQPVAPFRYSLVAQPDVAANHYLLVRSLLLHCGPFATNRELRAVFADPRLQPWRDTVPDADNPAARVAALLDCLHDRAHSELGQNALVLFLNAVADLIPTGDLCSQQLRSTAHFLVQLMLDSGQGSPFTTLYSAAGSGRPDLQAPPA